MIGPHDQVTQNKKSNITPTSQIKSNCRANKKKLADLFIRREKGDTLEGGSGKGAIWEGTRLGTITEAGRNAVLHRPPPLPIGGSSGAAAAAAMMSNLLLGPL